MKRIAPHAVVATIVVLAVLALLDISGAVSLHSSGGLGLANLPPADAPPLEYVYLDSPGVAAYLGQVEDGLPTTEQRTEQITRSVSASLSAASAAQLGASEQKQQGTQATVTPTAADRFYTFMQLLREGGEASCNPISTAGGSCDPKGCNGTSRTRWLGEVDAEWPARRIMDEVNCIGVGNFVRIAHAQLFLPPFAQALPHVQSTNAVYGALPAPRTAFTSPTQSNQVRAGLSGYASTIGPNPRLPFVAAPYGSYAQVGSGVTIYLPTQYQGLTSEPTLLSGSVTVVGKIVYLAPGGLPYIDYATLSAFGRAVLGAQTPFLSLLGVCSGKPPPPTRAQRASSGAPAVKCTNEQQTLDNIKKSVTFKPPVVVVLPLAIYD